MHIISRCLEIQSNNHVQLADFLICLDFRFHQLHGGGGGGVRFLVEISSHVICVSAMYHNAKMFMIRTVWVK